MSQGAQPIERQMLSEAFVGPPAPTSSLLPFAFRSGDIDVEVSKIVAAEPADLAFHYSTAA